MIKIKEEEAEKKLKEEDINLKRKPEEKCANIFQKKHTKEKEENIQGNNKYIIKIDINQCNLY